MAAGVRFVPAKWLVLLCLLAGMGIAGCITVGPDYTPPETETPQAWNLRGRDPAIKAGKADIEQWWGVFSDPLLTSLIQRATQENLDLKTAVARVEQARYQIGVVAGQELPAVSGSGSVTNNRQSEDLGYAGNTYTSYTAGLSASWEIDLFGRIRRSVEAAQADYQATIEDRNDVLVSLLAQVAREYLTLRADQTRLASAVSNIQSQREVLQLTKVRFDNGLATGLDVAQAMSVLASSQAELPPLRSEMNQSANNLSLLVGAPPGQLNAMLRPPRPIPQPPVAVRVGVPADLVRRRPDVRRAERQLAAATARIGVAEADLYPSFTITGSIGLSALDADKFFNYGSHFFSVGPGFSWNLFQGGAIRSQIKAQEAATQAALLTYQQAVLNALSEADSAFEGYRQQLERVGALDAAVKAQRRTLDMAVQLYKEGLTNFQAVLDAQRELFNYDNQLAQARGQAGINLVQVYQALGGGWPASGPAADQEKKTK